MAEYAVMGGYVELKPDVFTAPCNQVTETIIASVNHELEKTKKGLKSFLGGGWEIVSHEVTRIEHCLVVSFIVCRGK